MTCSTYRGLPSAAAAMRSRAAGGMRRSLEQGLDEVFRFRGRERFEEERRRIRLATAPPRPDVEELGSRHRQQDQRDAVDPVREVLDEVEEGRFGPLQVVEHDDDGSVGRESLEEAADRPEEFLDRGRLGRDPEWLGERRQDRLGVLDARRGDRATGP